MTLNTAIACYKAVEPALSGYCWGLMSVAWATGSQASQSDLVTVTSTVFAFNAYPLSTIQKGFAAIALGVGTSFAGRVTWFKKEKLKIVCIVNLALSCLELYQGQRAYPLGKIGVIGLFFIQDFSKKNSDLFQRIDKFLYKSLIVIAPLYLGGNVIQLAAPVVQKIAGLERRTKVIAAATLTLACFAVYVKLQINAIHAHYARHRQRQRGPRPMVPRQP